MIDSLQRARRVLAEASARGLGGPSVQRAEEILARASDLPSTFDAVAELDLPPALLGTLHEVYGSTPPPAQPAPERPRQLGGYTIVRPLGQGGMGMVYVGQDPEGRPVAIKICQSLAGHASERFSRECASLARIRHPHVVRYLDAGLGPPPFLVMDHVEGESLGERLRRGPLEPDEARRVCAEVAEGIAAAHALGIQHRDVKPANVLLRASDGAALVADFGLTRTLESTTLTRSGTLIGTLAYAAPEQARGKRTGPEADAWSLGALLFHCLAGQPPFVAENEFQLALAVVEGHVPRLCSLAPGAPADLEALCTDCLQQDPALRPRPEEIAARLRGWVRPSAGPPQVWKRVAGLVGGLLILLLLALAIGVLLPEEPPAGPGDTAGTSSSPTPPPPLAAGLPQGWASVWVGPAGAEFDRPALWESPQQASPLRPDARSVAFAGTVRVREGGRLEVRYPAREVRLEIYKPERYVVIAEGVPSAQADGEDRLRYQVPTDSQGVVLTPGNARWEAPRVTWDLALRGRFQVRLILGGVSQGKRFHRLVYSRRGPRAFLSSRPHRVELPRTADGQAQRITLGASRAGEPGVAFADEDLSVLEPSFAEPATPGAALLYVMSGDVSLGPVVIRGRPLRVDRPAVALAPAHEAPRLLIQASYRSEPLNRQSGPFLVASSGLEQIALERTADKLNLVSLRDARTLATVTCPVLEGPESLELELAGPLVSGRLRGGDGQLLATIHLPWEAWRPGPIRLGFGSSGPTIRFSRVELGARQEDLPVDSGALQSWAKLSRRIAGLCDPRQSPALCGPSRRSAQWEAARQAGRELEALLPRLGPLRLAAKARILQAAVVAGEVDRAQLLAQDLRRNEAGIERVREAVDRLTWNPRTQTPGYLEVLSRGPTVDRDNQILLASAQVCFELLPSDQHASPARVYADVLLEAYRKRSPEEPRSAVWDSRLEDARARLSIHSAGHARMLAAEAALCVALGRLEEALRCYDQAVVARDFWFTWAERARVLRGLGRTDEWFLSLLAMLASQPTKPNAAIARARDGLTSRELQAQRPGSWAALNLAAIRLTKGGFEQLRAVLRQLPPPTQPRERDLLIYVGVCLGDTAAPRGQRPLQVLARARAGDPKARAALADLALEDFLLRCVARSDPDLIGLVPQYPFPALR
ncbi:MAG: serine/threonine protein kinase [Planctomycetes bacterium]|nr:serine/threonine protein kinase [Planctomycetota bacterium]